MKTISPKEIILSIILLLSIGLFAQKKSDRELILIDKDWRFLPTAIDMPLLFSTSIENIFLKPILISFD